MTSYKYSKYPGPSAKKRSLFMANELILDTSANRSAVFLAAIHHPKWPYQGTSAKSSCQINGKLTFICLAAKNALKKESAEVS